MHNNINISIVKSINRISPMISIISAGTLQLRGLFETFDYSRPVLYSNISHTTHEFFFSTIVIRTN